MTLHCSETTISRLFFSPQVLSIHPLVALLLAYISLINEVRKQWPHFFQQQIYQVSGNTHTQTDALQLWGMKSIGFSHLKTRARMGTGSCPLCYSPSNSTPLFYITDFPFFYWTTPYMTQNAVKYFWLPAHSNEDLIPYSQNHWKSCFHFLWIFYSPTIHLSRW